MSTTHSPLANLAVDGRQGASHHMVAGVLSRAEELAALVRHDEAMDCVRFALAAARNDSEAWRRGGEVAVICGDMDVAWTCWSGLAATEPWEPGWPIRLAEAAEQRTEYDLACEIMATARERWPGHPTVQSHNLYFGGLYGRSNSSETEASSLLTSSSPSVTLSAARWLASLGEFGRAREALQRIPAMTDDADLVRSAEVELRSLDHLEEVARQDATAVPGFLSVGRSAVFHRCRGADTTVVVFTGMGARIGISVNAFHAILVQLGVNAIYLFDEERLLHMNGNSLLGRGYDRMLEAMRKMLHAWGATRTVCIGNSAGGYAALRYGIDLEAARVLGFAAPTTLEPEKIRREGGGLAVIRRMERYIPHLMTNTRTPLEEREHPPRVDLYYGEGMPIDRGRAENLAGLPCVSLHPIAGLESHDALGELVLTSRLPGILAEACRPEDDERCE